MRLRKQKDRATIASPRRRRLVLLAGATVLASCSGLGEQAGPHVYARVYQAEKILYVSVTGLRPGERVTAITLVAADGSETAFTSGTVRQRAAGEAAPGRGTTISSDKAGGGVTFGARVPLRRGRRRPPQRPSLSGEAEARLPLENAVEVAANPEAYSVQVEYLDRDGMTRVISVTPRA